MLNGKEKRFLRSLANTMEPIVQVGKGSVTESVLHSLNCLDEVDEVAQALAEQSGAELVQVIGRNVVLYRRHPKKPVIELPKK